MPTFDVHVYRVVRMQHMDIDAPNEVAARAVALTRTDATDWKTSPMADCKRIAIIWDEKHTIVSISDDVKRRG